MTENVVVEGGKKVTLMQRVEQALQTAGIPRAADGQRGWMAESARGTVRLYWGYGEPALKTERAQSALGQCYYFLNDAGFRLPDKVFKDGENYIEVLS